MKAITRIAIVAALLGALTWAETPGSSGAAFAYSCRVKKKLKNCPFKKKAKKSLKNQDLKKLAKKYFG